MFGLPFPTYLGWFMGPGIMVFTFLLSLGLYRSYIKKENANKEENKKD